MRLVPRSLSFVVHLCVTAILVAALALALGMLFLYAPTEATMGDVQRILYLHVSVAWCGLAASVAMGGYGLLYLVRRQLSYDHWAQATGEVSWLCVTLTLITGSFWAHEAWGVWWTWEPRLMSSFVLWLLYAGIFLTRGGIDDVHQRARTGSILAILAVVDIPLIVMATRWFRGVHPVAPRMDDRMHLTLLVAALSFTAFFACCIYQRRRQLELTERLADLSARLDPF